MRASSVYVRRHNKAQKRTNSTDDHWNKTICLHNKINNYTVDNISVSNDDNNNIAKTLKSSEDDNTHPKSNTRNQDGFNLNTLSKTQRIIRAVSSTLSLSVKSLSAFSCFLRPLGFLKDVTQHDVQNKKETPVSSDNLLMKIKSSESSFYDDNLILKKEIEDNDVPSPKELPKYLKHKRSILRQSETVPILTTAVYCSPSHIEDFLRLIEEDPMIHLFLKRDICRLYADKFLLAMVLIYFVRVKLTPEHFTRHNFFAALYLAHDMVEDSDEIKYEIFPFCFGSQWRKVYTYLLNLRDEFFWGMDCRAAVSKKACEQLMDMAEDHPFWKRERPEYHGDILRQSYLFSKPRGPYKKPLWCRSCLERECAESDDSYIVYATQEDITCSSLEEEEDDQKTECDPNEKQKIDSGFESFFLAHQGDESEDFDNEDEILDREDDDDQIDLTSDESIDSMTLKLSPIY